MLRRDTNITILNDPGAPHDGVDRNAGSLGGKPGASGAGIRQNGRTSDTGVLPASANTLGVAGLSPGQYTFGEAFGIRPYVHTSPSNRELTSGVADTTPTSNTAIQVPRRVLDKSYIPDFARLKKYLSPVNMYFKGACAEIEHFSLYKFDVREDRYGFLFPKVKAKENNSLSRNPYHKQELTRAHVSRTMDMLNSLNRVSGGHLRVVNMVNTIPEETSEALANMGADGINIFKRVAMKFFKEDVPEIVGMEGKPGALLHTHPWASHNPVKAHFHIDVLMPSVALQDNGDFKPWFGHILKRYTGADGAEHRGAIPLSDDELREYKSRWTKRVRAMCKRNSLPVGRFLNTNSDGTCDCNISYFDMKGSKDNRTKGLEGLRNKVAYCRRDWRIDYCEQFGHIRNAVQPPAWLETYQNRAVPIGYWRNLRKYLKDDEGEEEKYMKRHTSPDGEPLYFDRIITVHQFFDELINEEDVGAYDRLPDGRLVPWTLDHNDITWLYFHSCRDDVFY